MSDKQSDAKPPPTPEAAKSDAKPPKPERSPFQPHELFLVAALDAVVDPEIAEVPFSEIVGLTGEFKPEEIITDLASETSRIADILVACTGAKRSFSLQKARKLNDAISDLNDALNPELVDEEGKPATTPKELYETITSADLVRFMDQQRIFNLIFSHRWTEERTEKRTKLAYKLLVALIDLKLLPNATIVERLSTAQLMGDNMPAAVRKFMLDAALSLGRATTSEGEPKKAFPFDDQQVVVVIKNKAKEIAENIALTIIELLFRDVGTTYKLIPEPKPAETKPVTASDESTSGHTADAATDDNRATNRPAPPDEAVATPAIPPAAQLPAQAGTEAPGPALETGSEELLDQDQLASHGAARPSGDVSNTNPDEVSNAIRKNPTLVDDAIDGIMAAGNQPTANPDDKAKPGVPRPVSPAGGAKPGKSPPPLPHKK